jgi:two-component system, NarL family, nitrate/nitrite response regulator NarL
MPASVPPRAGRGRRRDIFPAYYLYRSTDLRPIQRLRLSDCFARGGAAGARQRGKEPRMSFPSTLETRCIRVVHIDEQLLFRVGISSLMGESSGIKVVGGAGTRAAALALVQGEQPDVILLDLAFKEGSSLDFLPDLREAAGQAKVLILTGVADQELHRKAVRLGARGLVFKDAPVDMLIKAIEKVCAGELWLDRVTTAAVFDELSRRKESRNPNPEESKIATLTAREREVICLVGEGLKNKQIGERLFISDVTVRHHLTSIFNKLDVADRLELVIYAYRHGLAPIPR